MKVYRLAREKYARTLTGTGAKLYGGRWNSKGKNALYTAQNISLAKLEVAVHLDLDLIPKDYCLVTIEISDNASIKVIDISELSSHWNSIPPSYATQLLGDKFLDSNEYLAIKVPSAIVYQEYNYILNPNYSNFQDVKVIDVQLFTFDNRLFK